MFSPSAYYRTDSVFFFILVCRNGFSYYLIGTEQPVCTFAGNGYLILLCQELGCSFQNPDVHHPHECRVCPYPFHFDYISFMGYG